MNSILTLSLLGWLHYAGAEPLPPIARAPTTTATSIPPLTSAPALTIPTSLPHTPHSSIPTPLSGAVNASSLGIGSGIVPSSSIAPAATTYPADGVLHDPQPGPYIPAGGGGTNGTIPVYNTKSDFDFESLV